MSSVNGLNPSVILQSYDEIPGRTTESSIGDKRYQTVVLKSKEVNLDRLHRCLEGLGLFILTLGTFGLALSSYRVRDAWKEVITGRSIMYIKTPIGTGHAISSSSVPIFHLGSRLSDISKELIEISGIKEALGDLGSANYYIHYGSDLNSLSKKTFDELSLDPELPLIILNLCFNKADSSLNEKMTMEKIQTVKGVVRIERDEYDPTLININYEKVKELLRP